MPDTAVTNRALVRVQLADSSATFEEFSLNPPTAKLDEVERQWRAANPPDKGRDYVDADLLPVVVAPVAAETKPAKK